MRETTTVMRRLALLPLAVLIAACGSSGAGQASTSSSAPAAAAPSSTTTSATATATTTTSSSTATTTTPTTTTTSTAATTTTTSASSGTLACRAAGLSLSFLGQQGGMGHGEIGFALRNTGHATCHTYGYPGVLFLGRNGNPLPTIPHHTTQDFFGTSPEAHLDVAPGATVSFRLDVGHGVATSAGCATAYRLQVIPPDDTATLRTAIPNGSYECRDANVSPVRSGNSAYP